MTEDEVTMPELLEDNATEAQQRTYDDQLAKHKEWKGDNAKAMGIIWLRVSAAIANTIKGKTTAQEMWMQLLDNHGKLGLAAIYAKFKSAIELQISNNQNPAPAIAKL